VLADAGRKEDNEMRNPVADSENGLLLRDAVGSGMDDIPNRMLDEFRQRSNREQRAESLRLLYVALTRARDRLIISEGAMVQGWAKEIRGLIGDQFCISFVSSGKEREFFQHDGVKIVLVRPDGRRAERRIAPVPESVDSAQIRALAYRRLDFELPHSRELVITPTALADFERCPRQFHFRHRLKLSEPTPDGPGGMSNASTMGTVAHAVLERLRLEAATEAEIRQLVEQLGVAAGLPPRERAVLVDDLFRYVAKAPSMAPATRELPFFYCVGEAMFIRGRIDAIIDHGGSVVVRDYKYGDAGERTSFYQLQMEAYALAVAEAYPCATVEAEIVFLRGDNVTVPVCLPPWSEIRARLLALGHEIVAAQATGVFSRKPTSAAVCRKLSCGFIGRCWEG
jgi:ATP-dependent exoDNAse (exonuclease V) beta subunit